MCRSVSSLRTLAETHTGSHPRISSGGARATIREILSQCHGTEYKAEPSCAAVTYGSKYYHKVVFAEDHKPLSQVESLYDAFHALLYTVCVLFLMHETDWVHQDINISNIFVLDDKSEGHLGLKLLDLEYAKSPVDGVEVVRDVRMGSANFMALEVDSNHYLFKTTGAKYEIEESDCARVLKDAHTLFRTFAKGIPRPVSNAAMRAPTRRERPAVKTEVKPFRYNYTHDFESLWWIAVFFVVNKETAEAPFQAGIGDETESLGIKDTADAFVSSVYQDERKGNVGSSLTSTQRYYARRLFYGFKARYLAMVVVDDNPLDQHMRSLPSHLSRICEPLIELRQAIRNHYGIIERPGFAIANTVCDDLCISFMGTFSTILDSLLERDIIATPL